MHSAEKAQLRSELQAVRKARTPSQIDAARTALRAAVRERCTARGWRCVAAYVPLRTEPGSPELLDGLAAAGIRVLVPVLLPDRDLDWAEWDATLGAPGAALGVAAITAAEAVFVPALAVARDGTRIGRGGGSYDRVLPRVPHGVPVVALLYSGELVDDLPRDPWDHPVTAVVTPDGWTDLDTSGQS